MGPNLSRDARVCGNGIGGGFMAARRNCTFGRKLRGLAKSGLTSELYPPKGRESTDGCFWK